MYNTHPNFSLVFGLRNSYIVCIKTPANDDKYCSSVSAQLSKMPGSLTLLCDSLLHTGHI